MEVNVQQASYKPGFVAKLSNSRIEILTNGRDLLPFYLKTQERIYSQNLQAFYGVCRYILYYAQWDPLKIEKYMKESLIAVNIKPTNRDILVALQHPEFDTETAQAVCTEVTKHLDFLVETASGGEYFNFSQELEHDFYNTFGEINDFEKLKALNGFVSAKYLKTSLESVVKYGVNSTQEAI